MIPAELTALPQWVGHDLIRKPDGKIDKPPYSPHGGLARCSDPRTWGTYDQALALVDSGKARVPGFAFTEACGLAGVDFDNCRDPETGTIEPWVMAQIRAFDTYAEISASGRGVKVIGRGRAPHNGKNGTKGRHPGQVEVYDRTRFFALTGNVLPGYDTIRDCQQQLEDLHLLEWPREEPHRADAAPAASLSLADDDIYQKARGAKNGAAFMSLYGGDTNAYGGDHSAADLALVSMLAFYTQDPDQLDRLFRSSGLMRKKWDRADYRTGTIDKVLSTIRETYNPGRTQAPPSTNTPSEVAALRAELAEAKEQLRIATALAQDATAIHARNVDYAEQVRQCAATNAAMRKVLMHPTMGASMKVIGMAALVHLNAREDSPKYTDPDLGTRTDMDVVARLSGMGTKTVGTAIQKLAAAGLWERKESRWTAPDGQLVTKVWLKADGTLAERTRALATLDVADTNHGGPREKKICAVCGSDDVHRHAHKACHACGNEWEKETTPLNPPETGGQDDARSTPPVDVAQTDGQDDAQRYIDTTDGQDDARSTPPVDVPSPPRPPVVHFVPEPGDGIEEVDPWRGAQPPASTVICRHVFGQECYAPGCKHQSRYVPVGAG